MLAQHGRVYHFKKRHILNIFCAWLCTGCMSHYDSPQQKPKGLGQQRDLF